MTTTDELRSKLGRVGIWMAPPAAVGLDPETAAEAIERAGFSSVWVGGGNAGPERLRGPAGAAERERAADRGARHRQHLGVGAGRDQGGGGAARGGLPRRFILGLGVSHAPLVAQLGQTYEQPLRKMERFLDELDHPAHRQRGTELPPIVLAALGPKMLQLSTRFAGAHPYFTTPEHTAEARAILGPEPLLIPEQAVSLDPLAAEGVRAYAARYLKMANYTRMLKNYGFTDADIADGGSDRLVNTVIPSGAAAARPSGPTSTRARTTWWSSRWARTGHSMSPS